MVTNMLLPAEEPRRVGLRVGTHVGSAGGDHSDEHHMEMEPSLSENNCPSQTQGFPLPCEFAGGGVEKCSDPRIAHSLASENRAWNMPVVARQKCRKLEWA